MLPTAWLPRATVIPDGTGLGYYDPAQLTPCLDKEPLAAFADSSYAREARHLSSVTFVSHIRYATTGERTPENTHPFTMEGRIFAHNGVARGLDKLEAEFGPDLANVKGQTDSERYFALVTKRIREHDGDVTAGIASATGWIADNIPVYSINFVMAEPDQLWAFRYPDTHRLHVLEREAGGPSGDRPLSHASDTLHVHAPELAGRPAVVVASEPLDDHPDWRLLDSGELIHVSPDLTVVSTVVRRPPAGGADPHRPSHRAGARVLEGLRMFTRYSRDFHPVANLTRVNAGCLP